MSSYKTGMSGNESLPKKVDPFGILDGAEGNPSDVPPAADEEKDILAALEAAFADAKQAHSPRRGLIDYCTLMLKGETYIARLINHEYLRTVVEGNPQRPRSTDNKMRVANRAFVAKLIKIIPSVRAKPRTSDRDDVIAADVMDSCLDAAWQGQNFKLKYKRAVSWIPRAGMGVLQAVWNSAAGRKMSVCPECGWNKPAEEHPAKDEQGSPQPCPACAAERDAAMMQSQIGSMMGPAGVQPPPAPVGPPGGGEGGLDGQPPSPPLGTDKTINPMWHATMGGPLPPPTPPAGPPSDPMSISVGGAPLGTPTQPPQAPGAAGGAMPQVPMLEEAMEGDLELRVIDPRDFIPDPGASHPEEMQYAWVKRVLPVPQIRKMFPDKWQLIQPEMGLYSDKFLATTYGTPLSQGRIEKKVLKNHAELKEYYEIPSPRFPKGRVISYCNGRILESKDNIAASLLGRLAFFVLRGDVDDGELWPEPIIMQAEGLQREFDIFTTQMRQHRDLTMNPPILVPVNSGIDDRFLERTPGKVIKYRPQAGEVQPMRTGQMPPYVVEEMGRLTNAIWEKWGVTPHELGQSMAGDSGRFAAFLDTVAQAVVSAMLIEIYSEWLALHRAWIVLARRYMSKDRVWTVYGTDKTRLVTNSWADANVLPGWDVYVVEDDAMAKNPVMRLNQACDLLSKAPFLFMDQQTGRYDEKKFRLMAGLKLESTAADTEASEHIYAAKMPDAVEAWMHGQGAQPMPQSFDDPWVMIEELKGWLQTHRDDDPKLVQAVETLWHVYIDAVMPQNTGQMPDPMQMKLMPATRLGQQGQQPGAQPQGMGPGAPPPNTQSDIATAQATPNQQAAQSVQATDKATEQLARGSQKHEG